MAEQRKYSVQEIDRMRNAIRRCYPSGVSYFEKERQTDIEDRLRTYMINGTNPEELEEMAHAQLKDDLNKIEGERLFFEYQRKRIQGGLAQKKAERK